MPRRSGSSPICVRPEPDCLRTLWSQLISAGFGSTLSLVAHLARPRRDLSPAGRLRPRCRRTRSLAALAYAYVYFFRGTPLIAQTFLIYYGAGSFAPELAPSALWCFFRDAYNCAVLAFALNTAAYQAEILPARSKPCRAASGGAAALGLHQC